MGKRGAQPWEPPVGITETGKQVGGWEAFDSLIAIQCGLSEIASYYNVSQNTIKRAVKRVHGVKFGLYFKQKRKRGFVTLRRKMWQLAQNGDKTMLIWLSKQHLKFSEKMTVREPKKDIAPPAANANSDQLARLETLLNEIKAPQNEDREQKMLAIAKRLGIEK